VILEVGYYKKIKRDETLFASIIKLRKWMK
jgi:hypothetical protein